MTTIGTMIDGHIDCVPWHSIMFAIAISCPCFKALSMAWALMSTPSGP